MLVKKAPTTASSNDNGYDKELEYLYARRTAINTLIDSLQEYDLSRVLWTEHEKRKSA
jgi:hypothetical protein